MKPFQSSKMRQWMVPVVATGILLLGCEGSSGSPVDDDSDSSNEGSASDDDDDHGSENTSLEDSDDNEDSDSSGTDEETAEESQNEDDDDDDDDVSHSDDDDDDDSDSGSGDDDDDSNTGENLACNVDIVEISAYTHNKVTLARDQVAIPASNSEDRGLGYLVVGRDAHFRVFVESNAATEEISAKLTVTSNSATSVYVDTKVPPAESSDHIASSTFNFDVPGSEIAQDTTYSVVLTQSSPCDSPGAARFPEEGEQDAEARVTGTLRVSILRTQINDLPAAVFDDETKSKLYADLRRYFPQVEVEISVLPDIERWSMPTVELGDQVPSWINCGDYFHANVEETRNFLICVYRQQEAWPTGVSGGMAYLTEEKDLATDQLGNDAMVVVGYPSELIPTDWSWDEWIRTTFVHELGHTLGAPHAPNGGAGDPDPAFPYPNGYIGTWGWNPDTSQLVATNIPDLMGYDWFAGPGIWLSDYNYGKFARRIERVENHPLQPAPTGTLRSYRTVILKDGRMPEVFDSMLKTARKPRGQGLSLAGRSLNQTLASPVEAIMQRSSHENIRRLLVPVEDGLTSVIVDGHEVSLNSP